MSWSNLDWIELTESWLDRIESYELIESWLHFNWIDQLSIEPRLDLLNLDWINENDRISIELSEC